MQAIFQSAQQLYEKREVSGSISQRYGSGYFPFLIKLLSGLKYCLQNKAQKYKELDSQHCLALLMIVSFPSSSSSSPFSSSARSTVRNLPSTSLKQGQCSKWTLACKLNHCCGSGSALNTGSGRFLMFFPAIDRYRGNTCEIFKMINTIAGEHIPGSIKLNNVYARYRLDSGQTSHAIYGPLRCVNQNFF